MQCLSPISIANPSTGNVKDRLSVPCGKCYACLSRRRNHWRIRLQEELKVSTSAFFVTLTYDEEHLPRDENGIGLLYKHDVQAFIKRLRKNIEPAKVRYFLVSEYGSKTLRPHYHMIIFNIPYSDPHKVIEKSWKNGKIHIGSVTDASISYCAKYCLAYHDFNAYSYFPRPFMLCSKQLGISYLTEKKLRWHRKGLKNYVQIEGGIKLSLPRYYKEKIFNKMERRLIAKKIENEILEEKKKMSFRDIENEFDSRQAYNIRVQNTIKRSGKL